MISRKNPQAVLGPHTRQSGQPWQNPQVPRGRRKAWRTGVAIVCCASLLGACSTLPRNSEPRALRAFSSAPQEPEQTVVPEHDADPGVLLRDFFQASANPSQNYQSARAFLSSDVAPSWPKQQSIRVIEGMETSTEPGSTDSKHTLRIRANVIGEMDSEGSFVPLNERMETSVVFERNEDDQWRMTTLPGVVIIERTDLRNHYEPRTLYFPSKNGKNLVGDRRWVYRGQEDMRDTLLGMLLHGPSETIRPAVRSDIPQNASLSVSTSGMLRFAGMSGLDREQRIAFAAQVVWTLAGANIGGPYSIEVDGAPVEEGLEEITTDDVADYNPEVGSTTVTPLYAISEDGALVTVSANMAEPVPGPLGSAGSMEQADITADGHIALTRESGEHTRLYLGKIDGGVEEALEAGTVTRPSFEQGTSAAWSVIDGSEVVRVVRSSSTGELVHTTVNTSALSALRREESANTDSEAGSASAGASEAAATSTHNTPEPPRAPMTELRLSPSGARAAMIIDSRVYVGIVDKGEAGGRAIVNPMEVSPQLAGRVTAVDWGTDGSLLVGTNEAGSPLFRVEQDGSETAAIASSTISAPVIAVADSGDKLYLTDSLAMRMMPDAPSGEEGYWREVPGLQGTRATPIVVH
ncbi:MULTISPECIES: LpqB family beta-propeller domain-containing protein [unclassified Corynebacterium]|uniref:LpqB family beta-propeller domain-containing protein n=1 Tax=unclassified Corynebacterium TaxID=2624378 RepID=UPI0029CAA748|nr:MULTISPECIES: LpqB family beta-propeller domain-containing protein [unclassified Corynebacterium]WPF66644.1 LpqB family beta-propeller domain-containing protein [Corynebacterium sp. 22KM0430]WPF69132.1 LpqB family beta-propeller domain-containing protein [Corynebacterium sp. 21KM1197]